MDTLHRSSDFTSTRQSTKEVTEHVETRLTKPESHLKSTRRIIVTKLPATPLASKLGHKPSFSGLQAKDDSEMMSPWRRNTQTTPPSPDLEDLRFPSEVATAVDTDARTPRRRLQQSLDTHRHHHRRFQQSRNENFFWSCKRNPFEPADFLLSQH
jgi:hypothetical protein